MNPSTDYNCIVTLGHQTLIAHNKRAQSIIDEPMPTRHGTSLAHAFLSSLRTHLPLLGALASRTRLNEIKPSSSRQNCSTSGMYECVVVGAGIVGSATAYNLVRKGTAGVLLLEQVCTRMHWRTHMQSFVTAALRMPRSPKATQGKGPLFCLGCRSC